MSDQNEKVSVEEIIAAIRDASSRFHDAQRANRKDDQGVHDKHGAINAYNRLEGLLYIHHERLTAELLAASKEIANRDAQIATIRFLWTKGREHRDARIEELYQQTARQSAQIAEAELAAAGALAQIVEMRAEINQITEERTTEVDGLRKQIADANGCSTCGGTPPSSGGPCVCGGTNSREREVEGLRGIVFDAQRKLADSVSGKLYDKHIAEWRAECGRIGRERDEILVQVSDAWRVRMDILTRQLATALEVVIGVAAELRTIPDLVAENGWSLTMTADVLRDYADTLAAIGAPATAGWDILVEAGEFFGVSANSSDAPPIDTALPVGYEECPDCDADANYHRDEVAHCAKCGWPPSDCEGHPKPEETPVPKVLHCPSCGLQHVDVDDNTGKWATTRLHRKHLCKPSDGGCGQVWRPFGYPTVGVREMSSRSSITTTTGDAVGVRSDHGVGLCAPAIRPLTADEARKLADGCESEALRHVRGFTPDVVDGLRRTAASWRRYADLLERGDALERAADEVIFAWAEPLRMTTRLTALTVPIDNLRSVLQRAKENR